MVVLLQPPFFRCAGSHNDRAPLELCYVSTYLKEANIEHKVVNSDYGGSTAHIAWRQLFENEEIWKLACDGKSPLFDECVEQVMQFEPETVVISAGDSCLSTKDLGSPYIASHISSLLRKRGVKTIGIGPMFICDQEPFQDRFDRLFRSMANRSLVDILVGEEPDVIFGTPVGSMPTFDFTYPEGCTTNYVMSSFGCSYDCSFCMAHKMTDRKFLFQPVDLFVEDCVSRKEEIGKRSLYIGDMIFPLNIRRLNVLKMALQRTHTWFEFSCEARTDTIRPEHLDVLGIMGVKNIKVGFESFDDDDLSSMSKRQTFEKEEKALELLKERDFHVTGYLIMGDFSTVDGLRRTLDRAKDLNVDNWVVNVSSYQSFGWDERRYDAHFSMAAARRQGVPENLVMEMLALQENTTNPTVNVLPFVA